VHAAVLFHRESRRGRAAYLALGFSVVGDYGIVLFSK
jgi:hypothetical protein